MIYTLKDGKLKENKEVAFKLEKDLQTLVENNLENLLGLKFIATEFPIENFRFDSVAYNEETKAFVIIEYKRGKNESLVDQGYAYLYTLLDRKADFVLLFNEKNKTSKTIKDFEWTQTRIVFISPNFTEYQKNATAFINMPFELYEVKQYEGGFISLNEINNRKATKVENEVVIKDQTVAKVEKEIVVYTEEGYLKSVSSKVEDLYFELKERIMELGNLKVDAKKLYIAFKNTGKNVCDIVLTQSALKLFINMKKGTLYDPEKIAEDIVDKGHWGNGDYQIILRNNEQFDYVMSLIKQSYKANA